MDELVVASLILQQPSNKSDGFYKAIDLQRMNPKCQSFKPVSKGILLLLVWSILLSAAGGFIVTTTMQIVFQNKTN